MIAMLPRMLECHHTSGHDLGPSCGNRCALRSAIPPVPASSGRAAVRRQSGALPGLGVASATRTSGLIGGLLVPASSLHVDSTSVILILREQLVDGSAELRSNPTAEVRPGRTCPLRTLPSVLTAGARQPENRGESRSKVEPRHLERPRAGPRGHGTEVTTMTRA